MALTLTAISLTLLVTLVLSELVCENFDSFYQLIHLNAISVQDPCQELCILGSSADMSCPSSPCPCIRGPQDGEMAFYMNCAILGHFEQMMNYGHDITCQDICRLGNNAELTCPKSQCPCMRGDDITQSRVSSGCPCTESTVSPLCDGIATALATLTDQNNGNFPMWACKDACLAHPDLTCPNSRCLCLRGDDKTLCDSMNTVLTTLIEQNNGNLPTWFCTDACAAHPDLTCPRNRCPCLRGASAISLNQDDESECFWVQISNIISGDSSIQNAFSIDKSGGWKQVCSVSGDQQPRLYTIE